MELCLINGCAIESSIERIKEGQGVEGDMLIGGDCRMGVAG